VDDAARPRPKSRPDATPAGAPPAAALVPLGPGTVLGPYRLGREIGRGGMGVVYEAFGVREGSGGPREARLAIKVLLPETMASAGVRERFLREARIGLSLVHDNVVRTLDVGEDATRGATVHWLALEYVEGRTLRRLLEEMGTVPEALVREIARQAARGLAALHDAGIVHRDLKPENLLLADDRRLRIMDLGVAKSAAGGPSLTTDGQFVGSLRYAAPEQCDGSVVGPAADLYALGVVLYELLAGAPPFDGDAPLAILRAHLERPPQPVADRAPGVSDFLAALVSSLLAKRPEDRPASARELLRVLDEAEGGAWWAERRREARPRRPAAAAPPLPLVGRAAESRALLDAWRRARGGTGQVALVTGEAGVGKTRLVQELSGAARGEDAHVLGSAFPPAGDGGGLRAALASHFGTHPAAPGDLDGELVRRLGIAAPLAAAFSAFLRRRPPPTGVDPLDPDVGEALLVRLVQALSDEAPVLWVLEDLQFAPARSLRAALAIARATEKRRVMLVLTARPGFDAEFAAALERVPGSVRLDLARLAPDEVGALVRAAVGGGTSADDVTRAIAPRADGVPFFVLEMVRELERRGHLVREGARLRVGEPLAGARLPSALRELVRARLQSLFPEERATLDAAAVEGFEFDPDLVARVRGVPRIHVLEVLGRLERHDGLVRSGPRLCRFDHHLLHEVVYDEIPPLLRAEAHGRLADALEASPAGASGPAAASTRVVEHRLRGPDPEGALPRVLDAITHLQDVYRGEAAADVAKRALAVGTFRGSAEGVDVLVRLGRISLQLGRPKDAGDALAEAVATAERLGVGRLRVAAEKAHAAHFLQRGENEAALLAADRALALVAGSGAAHADALNLRGQALWGLGRHREARACHEEALAVSKAAGSRRLEARSSADLGIVLHEMGELEEAEARYRRGLRILEEDGDRRNAATVTGNLGNLLSDLGRRAEALRCYDETIRASREIGERAGEGVAWVNVGDARLRLGDVEGAREAFHHCERICVETGMRRVRGYALHGLGLAALWAGERAEGRRLLAEALAERRTISNRPGVADTLLALGALDVDEGRFEDGLRELSEAAVLSEAIGDPSGEVLARVRLAALSGGDPAAARAAFAAAETRLRADARLEARLLLWKAWRDPRDLAAARAVAEHLVRSAPEGSREAMAERVPAVREALEAAS
jgi:tetratricopeptide (TPR) repeat protein